MWRTVEETKKRRNSVENAFLLVPFPSSTFSLFFLMSDGANNAAEKNVIQEAFRDKSP